MANPANPKKEEVKAIDLAEENVPQQPPVIVNDPAAAPEDETEDYVAPTFEVGERVYYPHRQSQGGYRRGRIQELDASTATIGFEDGSFKAFSLDVLKKS